MNKYIYNFTLIKSYCRCVIVNDAEEFCRRSDKLGVHSMQLCLEIQGIPKDA